MVSRSTWHIARKEHKCECCCKSIEIGERYHYTFSLEPYPQEYRLHRFCKESVLDPIIDETQGYFEWDPPIDFYEWVSRFWNKHELGELREAEKKRLAIFYPPWFHLSSKDVYSD